MRVWNWLSLIGSRCQVKGVEERGLSLAWLERILFGHHEVSQLFYPGISIETASFRLWQNSNSDDFRKTILIQPRTSLKMHSLAVETQVFSS